jgi:selenocysteine lyase/cysteine desulfurase
LKERGISVTERPEGVRIATHFFNSEQDVDSCVQGLVEYRRTL